MPFFWKAITVGILMFLPIFSRAGDTTRFKPVGMVALQSSGIPGVFSTSFYGGIARSRWAVVGGPIWRNGLLNSSLYGKTNSLAAFGVLYRYYPNPPGRRFDLFFQAEMDYHHFRQRLKSSWWRSHLILSYGIRMRVFRRFSLFQHFGLGVHMDNAGGPYVLQPTGNFRLGISYGF